MTEAPPLDHLVLARFEVSASGRQMVHLLKKAIAALGPAGAYAVSINRQQGLAMHCAFEIETDADRFAASMKAVPLDADPEWKTCRAFTLDDKAHRLIDRIVATK